MKAIILAGGLGTRISEETSDKPKPMVEIGGKPMLWHIMSIFAKQGVTEFLIATGYKGNVISDWVGSVSEPWDVRAIETGLSTQTGGRIQQCMQKYPGERFFATYGDGLGNVNLSRLLEYHQSHGKLATVTAVHPPARFGALESDNGLVTHFAEKNQADSGWINGGYFVLEPEVAKYVNSNSEPFETGAMPRLVLERNLMSFQHSGFWQPMDTLREKQDLTKLVLNGEMPWLNITQ
jgi:glucose-1-phosphate cytidylyltransferase